MELCEIIKQKIIRDGPISFRDFMDMALYYPGLGYYTSPGDKIGVHGDDYTSATLAPVFGEMIGRQLEEMWQVLGKEKFTVVEYGAGTGALCKNILDYAEQNPEFYSKLKYCIIEKSASMRDKEKIVLPKKVTWHAQITELPNTHGIILSNELLDNFPVHRVVMQDCLMEIFVGYDNGFIEVLRPAGEALLNYFRQLGIILPKSFRTEINLHAIDWMNETASNLEKGFIVTIDYGFPSAELYSSSRNAGTLLCYHRHSINDNPYINIGKQDITAHVNFSALDHYGALNGLRSRGLAEQGHFLHALGLAGYLRNKELNNLYSAEKMGQVYKLLLSLGTRLKVMIQQKDIPWTGLMGMQFSRNVF